MRAQTLHVAPAAKFRGLADGGCGSRTQRRASDMIARQLLAIAGRVRGLPASKSGCAHGAWDQRCRTSAAGWSRELRAFEPRIIPTDLRLGCDTWDVRNMHLRLDWQRLGSCGSKPNGGSRPCGSLAAATAAARSGLEPVFIGSGFRPYVIYTIRGLRILSGY